MAYNLARNSRVFVTTNLNTATGAVTTTGLATNNTWELQVLDGFSFTQAPEATAISINEAGTTPNRGQRSFNTALAPVDISFSTYIRPRLSAGAVLAEERVLWNALVGNVGIEGTVQGGSTLTAIAATGTISTITRASTTAATATITGATLTPTVSAADITSDIAIYHLKGATVSGALAWYGPVKVKSYSGAGGTLVIEYLTAPAASAGATGPAMTGFKLDRASWVEYVTNSAVTTAASVVTTANSNKNQLQPIGFIFNVDNSWYTIDNCAIDQAVIDFGLDAIAMVAWTVKGTKLVEVDMSGVIGSNMAAANPVFGTGGGGLNGTATGKNTTANFITNKLSTTTLQSNLGGISGTPYTVVLTGGSITIANNITYVTPAIMGTVNLPIGYFTGARSITGTLNAYLRTGSGHTAALLDALLDQITAGGAGASETKYRLQVEIGGVSAGTRVELDMVGASIGIPSVDVQDVISTSITFNAQGTQTAIGAASAAYDIENTNDLTVRYYSL